MTDHGKVFEEDAAVDAHLEQGANVIDIRFDKLPPLLDGTSPFEMFNFTVRVRLDVHGDGTASAQGSDGTLIVPNSKSGARFVVAKTFKEGVSQGDRFKSYEV